MCDTEQTQGQIISDLWPIFGSRHSFTDLGSGPQIPLGYICLRVNIVMEQTTKPV